MIRGNCGTSVTTPCVLTPSGSCQQASPSPLPEAQCRRRLAARTLTRPAEATPPASPTRWLQTFKCCNTYLQVIVWSGPPFRIPFVADSDKFRLTDSVAEHHMAECGRLSRCFFGVGVGVPDGVPKPNRDCLARQTAITGLDVLVYA